MRIAKILFNAVVGFSMILSTGGTSMASIWSIPVAHAAAVTGVPNTMHYQGRLKSATTGAALSGTYDFIFTLYDESTGGTNVWTETHENVTVTSGYFEVTLGGTNSFADDGVDFTKNLYLDVSIEGESASSRVVVNAVPYAYTARAMENASSAPTGYAGRTYYNTATGEAYVYDALNLRWAETTADTLDEVYQGEITNTGDPEMTINQGLDFVSTGSANIGINLTSTGDFVVQDSGTTYLTISDAGAFTLLDSSSRTMVGSTAAGALTLGGNSGAATAITLDADAVAGSGITLDAYDATNNTTGTIVMHASSITQTTYGSSGYTLSVGDSGNMAMSTASGDISITAQGSNEHLNLTATNGDINLITQTAGGNINIGAGLGVSRTINVGTSTGSDTINIATDSTASDTVNIGNAGNATTINIDTGTGGLDVDLLGAMSLDGELVVVGGSADGNLANGDSDLYVVGDLEVDTTGRFDGSVILGDANTDTITMNAYVNDDVYVGASAESIDEVGFALSGNDVYFEDKVGMNGDVYIDGALDVDGTMTFDGALTINGQVTLGDGGDTVEINSSDWDVNATGDMTGIGAITMNGLLTGTLGATISGATTSINASSNFGTNINTGTSEGAVAIGGGSGTVAINSTVWDVAATGAVSITNGVDVIGLTIAPTFATTTAIDLSDADIGTALSVGDNDIVGLTGLINYTNFDVDASGNITNVSGITSDGAIATTSTLDVDGTANISDTTAGANVTMGNSTGNLTFASDNADFTLTDATDNVFQIVSSTAATLLDIDLGAADAMTLGDSSTTIALNSSDWDVNATGDMTGIGAITMDGALSGATSLATTGDLTVSGGDVTGANGNAIDIGEAVDGTMTFSRDDAGTVTLTSADSDADAALTVSAGGTGALTLGDAGSTTAITSSDWAVDAAGAITGASFDANGAGNSLTNVENADLAADTLDFTAFDDTMELDVATSITGAAGEIFSLVRTGTAAATENGMTLTFTAGVGDGSDVYSALNLGVTSADQSASSDKVYALNIANLASADAQGDEVAINIGTGWDTGIAFGANAIDGTYFDVATTTGAVTLTQQAVGTSPLTVTALDNATSASLDLDAHSVSGNLVDVDYVAETQTGAISVIDVDLTNLTNDNTNNLYGIMLNDFTSAGSTGNLYGIYQQGTNWDYGIYADDDVYFALDATVLGGDVTGANGNAIDIGEAVDGTMTFSRDDAGTVTLTAADNDANADLVLVGGGTANVQINIDADSEFNVTASAVPTADIATIQNSAFDSATDGVDALVIDMDVSHDTSGDLIHLIPSFVDTDGAVDANDTNDTWNVINIDAFTAQLTGDLDDAITNTLNALNIGNLTETTDEGETITSTAINIGTGWDTGIAFGVNAIDGTYFDVAAMNGAVSMGQPDDSNIPALTVSMHSVSGSIIDADYITETQTGAISALDIDLTNLTNNNANNLYGIMLNDFTSAGAGGNLYGIYQQGDAWDYGIYADDDVYFGKDATVLGGDVTGANGNAIDIGEAVDGTIVFSRDDAEAIVTLTAADTDANAIFRLQGGGTENLQINVDADSEFAVLATAAPTGDMVKITNTGSSSATDGVDAFQITYGIDDATGNVIDITPTFSHGDDVDSAETWTIIDVDAFTATNSIASTNQTAILHGLNFGDLTEAGTDLITSTGIEIGGGWDIGVAFSPGETITGNGTDLTIATGDRLLITTPNNGADDVNITGSVTVTNDLAVTDDFSVEGIMDLGTQDSMVDNDVTPSVSGASFFTGDAATDTVYAFDDDVAGQIWIIEHTADTTFDCDNSTDEGAGVGVDQLSCGAVDIVTAAGDTTMWYSDGTTAFLLNWVDESDTQTGADLAEWFPANEDVQAGDVLVAAGSPEHVEKATGSYQKGLIGVVSTQPGLILSQESETFSALVALAGRVPVKVSNENGAIEIGDYLTSSATIPGYAMKATEAGPVIGMALSNFDEAQGQVIIQVVNTWYQPVSSLQGGASSTAMMVETMTMDQLVAGDATFEGSVTVKEHLYGSRDMAGRAKIVANDDKVHVAFETEYAVQPIVTATLRSNVNIPGYWWIEEESTTGFDIRLDGSLSQDVEFNWIAVGVEDGVVSVSDGSEKMIEVYVKDGSAPVVEASVTEEPPVVEEVASEPVVEETPAPEVAPAEESVPVSSSEPTA